MAELPVAGLNQAQINAINAGGLALDNGDSAFGKYLLNGGGQIANVGAGVEIAIPDLPCFAPGTNIRTDRGDVAVEDVRVGDVVPTHGGALRRVVWTGQRRVEIAKHKRPWDVQPVRVAAGGFGPGVPARDLMLSPDHAVFDAAAGVLMPVRYLINGATIRQESVAAITWHHVELDAHDVLFAEGLPAESYLDTGNRGAFSGEAATQLHPEFARQVWQAQGCAPLVVEGPEIVARRAALLARAEALGARLTDDADIRVVLADGRELRPEPSEDGVLAFALPPRAGWVCLASRAAVPAETDPAGRDTRRLGIAVGGVLLDGEPAAPEAFGAGWYAQENDVRWTGGDAAFDAGAASELLVRVMPVSLRYWDDAAPSDFPQRPDRTVVAGEAIRPGLLRLRLATAGSDEVTDRPAAEAVSQAAWGPRSTAAQT
jgi:hypothetical protein